MHAPPRFYLLAEGRVFGHDDHVLRVPRDSLQIEEGRAVVSIEVGARDFPAGNVAAVDGAGKRVAGAVEGGKHEDHLEELGQVHEQLVEAGAADVAGSVAGVPFGEVEEVVGVDD